MSDSVLPLSDNRSPFHVNVPAHDSKPVLELVAYFKLWKHFIAALVAYLKDLVMAKEFELNLNLQLVGSVQFPGAKDLAFKCLQSVEKLSPQSLVSSTPKGEHNKTLAPVSSNVSVMSDGKRPGLAKTKSATSFLKNQTFAHKRTGSNLSLKSESSTHSSATSNSHKNHSQNHSHGGQHSLSTQYNGPTPINPIKFAPKSDVSIEPSTFPQKSLFTNMPQMLINHHMNIYAAQAKMCRELSNKLIPRLESLHKNLAIKIKEIRSLLKNDSFANPTLIKEVSKTGAIISTFAESVKRYLGPRPVLKADTDVEDDEASMGDPFLIKLRLDAQLKSQLVHENFIFASYVNLQNISRDLLNYVVKDLNGITEKLIRLVNAESVYACSSDQAIYNLGLTLRDKLNNVDYEWNNFIANNPNFLNVYESTARSPKREIRSFRDVIVPYANSLHSKCLRCGYMYKKQKVLKSYTSFFYLLTCNYLHEFKIDNAGSAEDHKVSPNHKKKQKGKVGGVVGPDDTPSKSYNLNNYSITTKSENDFKFVLTKISNPSHKFTFKCQNAKDFEAWSSELNDLLKFSNNHMKRFQFIEENLAMREQSKTPSEPSSSGTATPKRDLNLNLNNLLSNKASLQKIMSPTLSGIFTPKVQSPEENDGSAPKNPFEHTFSDLPQSGHNAAVLPVESPGATSPLSRSVLPNSTSGTPSEHVQEHENYLRLQNEILKQQQQLIDLSVSQSLGRPSLSRNSSSESVVSVLEQTNAGLSKFLDKNKDLMEHKDNHMAVELTSSLTIPTVTVLNIEAE